ncbi:hypothetical protein C2845_PM12G22300 [Panicum miliaceum]|uniref:Uncharacterized protein n=1 Tax=Panicum miliaceum TaxID=4540 RepID=A0A3L6QBI4_PANMI|nr:hypothetical protein C2845_PM12G22300 [Panicum miliaceum]
MKLSYWMMNPMKNRKNSTKLKRACFQHFKDDAWEVECAEEKQARGLIEMMSGWGSESPDVDCPCRRRQGAPERPKNRPSPGIYSFDKLDYKSLAAFID